MIISNIFFIVECKHVLIIIEYTKELGMISNETGIHSSSNEVDINTTWKIIKKNPFRKVTA